MSVAQTGRAVPLCTMACQRPLSSLLMVRALRSMRLHGAAPRLLSTSLPLRRREHYGGRQGRDGKNGDEAVEQASGAQEAIAKHHQQRSSVPNLRDFFEYVEESQLPMDPGPARLQYQMKGRPRGIEMAKRMVEKPVDIERGNIRRQTIANNIDYAEMGVLTPFGVLGLRAVGFLRTKDNHPEEVTDYSDNTRTARDEESMALESESMDQPSVYDRIRVAERRAVEIRKAQRNFTRPPWETRKNQ